MKEDASLKKGMRMNRNRFAERMAVAAGVFFLCAAPGLAQTQNGPPSPVPTTPKPLPVVRPKKAVRPTDDFAGLQYTDEQKAKIAQIQKDMKSRIDIVTKDEKLDADQKGAMIEGYERMERGQVFRVLTPEQQAEVRKKAHARNAAKQEEQKKKQPQPLPQPK
jgi:Spy/CpxP family protein refolding chaperone